MLAFPNRRVELVHPSRPLSSTESKYVFARRWESSSSSSAGVNARAIARGGLLVFIGIVVVLVVFEQLVERLDLRVALVERVAVGPLDLAGVDLHHDRRDRAARVPRLLDQVSDAVEPDALVIDHEQRDLVDLDLVAHRISRSRNR